MGWASCGLVVGRCSQNCPGGFLCPTPLLALSVEDSTITRDVKIAIREDLKPRYTSPPTLRDYLHRSTALDLRFKSLSHMDPAPRQRAYSDVTTEIVSSLGTEDCDEVKKKNII